MLAEPTGLRFAGLGRSTRANDCNRTRRLGGHFGGNTPEQIAQQRVLPRADQYLIDRVGLDEFEDRICRIDGFSTCTVRR